jgi:hypothetical protein
VDAASVTTQDNRFIEPSLTSNVMPISYATSESR